MPVDKFGRSQTIKKNSNQQSTASTNGYVVTSSGDINVQDRRICNVQLKPIKNHEVTSKQYVDSLYDDLMKRLNLIEALVVKINKKRVLEEL